MAKIFQSVLRAITYAAAAVFRFPICCSVWKSERFRVN